MKRVLIALASIIALYALAQTPSDDWAAGIGQRDQVTKGLVSYWSMRNSGTTVYDEWGTNTGTAANGPVFAYTNGVIGNGASFNGVDQYVDMGDADTLAFQQADSFSISAWANRKGDSPSNIYGGVIAGKGAFAGGESGYSLYVDDVTDLFVGQVRQDNTILFVNGPTCVDGLWYHVVLTRDTSTQSCSIYQNGSVFTNVSESALLDIDTAEAFRIGDLFKGEREFYGSIDEVRIYNRALTPAEIKTLYRMGAAIYQNR